MRDIYQDVTDKIVTALGQGVAPGSNPGPQVAQLTSVIMRQALSLGPRSMADQPVDMTANGTQRHLIHGRRDPKPRRHALAI
jgi:hypothetical protein